MQLSIELQATNNKFHTNFSESIFKSINQIKFISLRNSMNIITVERITVSRNSKAEVALTAVL